MTDEERLAIKSVAEQTYATAKEKGWWPKAREETTPEEISNKLMLTVSELAEALEELRNDQPHIYYSLEHEDNGVKFRMPLRPDEEVRCPPAKPEGFGIELADAVIRIFDLAEHMGIDMGEMLMIKMHFNKTRPFRHGGKVL